MKNKNTALLFATYQARKTKAQKTAFIQHACSAAADAGYMSNVENTKNGARNVVVGDVSSASVVYTAHYDTGSQSPIAGLIFPKTPILTTLYQVICALLMLVPSAVAFLLSVYLLPLTTLPMAVCVLVGIVLAAVALVLCLRKFLCGPEKKNNANYNTSGVATLFEIMEAVPSKYRSKVAFVFFDGSINGLIGAADFAKSHKHISKKLFVNFDCVGVGDRFIVALTRGAARFSTAIDAAFASTGKIKAEVMSGANRIPSDHNKFKCAIGVCAFEDTNSGIRLKINNNDDDTVCSDENVSYAANAGVNLVRFIFDPAEINAPKAAPLAEKIKEELKVEQPAPTVEEKPDEQQNAPISQKEPAITSEEVIMEALGVVKEALAVVKEAPVIVKEVPVVDKEESVANAAVNVESEKETPALKEIPVVGKNPVDEKTPASEDAAKEVTDTKDSVAEATIEEAPIIEEADAEEEISAEATGEETALTK